MMAALWQDVASDLTSATMHFGEAIRIFEVPAFLSDDGPDYMHRMAFQHAMQSGYTSFEAGLKRIFAILEEPAPMGGDWHSALLRRAEDPLAGSRPAILTPPLAAACRELMGFRHVAMHGYDRFDTEKASIAVRAAKAFLATVDDDIAAFRAVIDP